MRDWTKEQSDAISAPNTGLIVSAAAGSGKTAVLVERLCRQICENIPIQKIIVVTFTEDAASQLKNRLSEVLRQKIAQNPNDQWLVEQQNMLGSAKISTISSFCFNILRENINMLEVSPNFRIIESTEENILLQATANQTIEELYTKNPDDIKALDDYFCKKFESKCVDFLISMHRFLVSIPFWREFLSNTQSYLENLSKDCKAVSKDYCEYIKIKLNSFAKQCDAVSKICSIDFESYKIYFETTADMFNSLYDSISCDNVFEKICELKEFKLPNMPQMRNLPEDLEAEKEYLSGLKTAVAEDIKSFKKMLFCKEEIEKDFADNATLFALFARTYTSFADNLWKAKCEKNVLAFSDGEQLALELLSDSNAYDGKSEIARNMSEFYEIIACDEYQDVNNVQQMIFKLVSKNSTNLFAVGDIKQSIYRFRQANPNIFLDTASNADEYAGEKSEKMQSIILAKNFRSSQQTVDFVNLMFSQLMSKACGDVEYTGKEKLVCGADFDDDDRRTEIMLIETDCEDKDRKSKLCESDAVALKIKSMIDSGVQVSISRNEKRPCRSSDFCILMSTKARFSEFKNALEAVGIRASAMTKDGYLNSREIMLLRDILRVIDNPTADISIAACALSPIFSFTPDELSQAKILCKDIPLYSALVQCSESNEVSTVLREKSARLVKTLEKLRIHSAGCSLCELIQKIYITTDLMSIMQLYSDSDKKSANLRLMLSYAQGYEQASAGGLAGFLRYLDSINTRSGDLSVAQTVSGSDDAVTISTIHASKGLEYPFVFVCDNRHKFNTRDTSDKILLHKTFGFGAKFVSRKSLQDYETYPHAWIKQTIANESASESMRLLYVALTRAKERLFITLVNNKTLKNKVNSFAIAVNSNTLKSNAENAKSFEDWFVPVIIADSSGKALRVLSDTPVNTLTNTDFIVNQIDPLEDFFKLSDIGNQYSENKTLTAKIVNSICNTHDNNESQLHSKLTVTELGHTHEVELKTPEFARSDVLTGAQKGTALHKFMQRCSFENTDVKSQAENLARRNILTHQEAECVDIKAVNAFFASDIFDKIKQSRFVKRELEFLISIGDLNPESTLFDDCIPSEYKNSDTMLQGVIDCIFEHDGKLILLDYKSDKTSCDAILCRYRNQLRLYAQCAKVFLRKDISTAFIWSFENKCAIEVKIDK